MKVRDEQSVAPRKRSMRRTRAVGMGLSAIDGGFVGTLVLDVRRGGAGGGPGERLLLLLVALSLLLWLLFRWAEKAIEAAATLPMDWLISGFEA